MDFQVCQPQKEARVLCHLKQPLINGLRPKENSAWVFLLELDRGKLGTKLGIAVQYERHASSVF